MSVGAGRPIKRGVREENGDYVIKLGSELVFNAIEKDIVHAVNEYRETHKLGKLLSNLLRYLFEHPEKFEGVDLTKEFIGNRRANFEKAVFTHFDDLNTQLAELNTFVSQLNVLVEVGNICGIAQRVTFVSEAVTILRNYVDKLKKDFGGETIPIGAVEKLMIVDLPEGGRDAKPVLLPNEKYEEALSDRVFNSVMSRISEMIAMGQLSQLGQQSNMAIISSSNAQTQPTSPIKREVFANSNTVEETHKEEKPIIVPVSRVINNDIVEDFEFIDEDSDTEDTLSSSGTSFDDLMGSYTLGGSLLK